MEFSEETLTQLTMDRSVPRRECVPNSKQATKNAAANLNGVEGGGEGSVGETVASRGYYHHFMCARI